jgi:hypothetical protein
MVWQGLSSHGVCEYNVKIKLNLVLESDSMQEEISQCVELQEETGRSKPKRGGGLVATGVVICHRRILVLPSSYCKH